MRICLLINKQVYRLEWLQGFGRVMAPFRILAKKIRVWIKFTSKVVV